MSPSKNRRPVSLLLTALTLMLLSACGRRPLYSHFEHVDADGWRRMDTLHFAVPMPAADRCRLRLDLRLNSRYPFTQAVLAVTWHHAADGKQAGADTAPADRHTETVTFDVADAEGDMRGQGLSLHLFTMPLSTVSPAGTADTLLVSITHCMTLTPLPGIADVGITAEALQAE